MLELYEVEGGPYASREEVMAKQGGVLPLNTQILGEPARAAAPAEYWLLDRTPVVTGRDLRDASAAAGRYGQVGDEFRADAGCGQAIRTVHRSEHWQRLAIVLDKVVISAPPSKAKSAITAGLRVRRATTTRPIWRSICARVRCRRASSIWKSGRVGPSLGADSIRDGIVFGHRGRACRRDRDAGVLQKAAASTRLWR